MFFTYLFFYFSQPPLSLSRYNVKLIYGTFISKHMENQGCEREEAIGEEKAGTVQPGVTMPILLLPQETVVFGKVVRAVCPLCKRERWHAVRNPLYSTIPLELLSDEVELAIFLESWHVSRSGLSGHGAFDWDANAIEQVAPIIVMTKRKHVKVLDVPKHTATKILRKPTADRIFIIRYGTDTIYLIKEAYWKDEKIRVVYSVCYQCVGREMREPYARQGRLYIYNATSSKVLWAGYRKTESLGKAQSEVLNHTFLNARGEPVQVKVRESGGYFIAIDTTKGEITVRHPEHDEITLARGCYYLGFHPYPERRRRYAD